MIGLAAAIAKARPKPGELVLHAYPATSYGAPCFIYGYRLDQDQIDQERGYTKVFTELTGSPGKWARFREAAHAWHLICGKSQKAWKAISRPIVAFIRNPTGGAKITPNDYTIPQTVRNPAFFEDEVEDCPAPGDYIRYSRAEAPDKRGVNQSFAYPGYWVIDYCKFLDRFPDWLTAEDDKDPEKKKSGDRAQGRGYKGGRRPW